MATAEALWSNVLPEVKNAVTGVGVWTALNNVRAVAFEKGQFVIGLPPEVSDLAGHLRMHQTKTLIERILGAKLGETVVLRVIDGIQPGDWESTKRRDAEALRLQQQAMDRQRVEIQARSSWDQVYDQISRKFAAMTNKSLPQNRAKFFEESVDLLIQSLKVMPIEDDLAERNFARCIERIATYADLPSTYVALRVAERARS